MRNQRRFQRLNEKWQLTYHILEEDHFLSGPIHQYTLNISGGGTCFTTDEEIKPGTPVALELNSDQYPAPILALANVVWCKRRRHTYEVGAEFWWVGWKNDSAQRTIANYVAAATEGDNEAADNSAA